MTFEYLRNKVGKEYIAFWRDKYIDIEVRVREERKDSLLVSGVESYVVEYDSIFHESEEYFFEERDKAIVKAVDLLGHDIGRWEDEVGYWLEE